MDKKKGDGVVPFYREWDGGELFPIAVDAGTSGIPVDVEDWTEALQQGVPKQPVPQVAVPVQGDIFECGICFETMFMPVMPLCMHVYCYECLRDWFLAGRLRCPYCSAPAKEKPIRDNAFELELATAISDGLERNSKQEGVKVTGDDGNYDWDYFIFENEA
ncbi:hypothetical protein C8R43DRAFT_1124818 [Mycena crocata]|nr:hypothetical protein C8R43DRAFT_1124818 [Mycena crocata]